MTPLTNAQVDYLRQCYHASIDNTIHDGAGEFVRADLVEELALEVQQSRQRRCDGCQWSGPAQHPKDYWLFCRALQMHRASDWHCADFTPKEEV